MQKLKSKNFVPLQGWLAYCKDAARIVGK
jgi:hypothetical protein